MTIPTYRETIKPIPGKSANVFWFTFAVFVLSAIGLWSLFQSIETEDSRWLTGPISSLFSLIMLGYRITKHDELCYTIHSEEIKPAIENSRPQTALVPEIHKTGSMPNNHTLMPGKPDLTALRPRQLQKLAEAITRNNGKLIRKIVPKGTFLNITDRWDDILKEFQRLGYIGDNQFVTQDGVRWLSGHYPPIMEIAKLNEPIRPTTTDDDRRRPEDYENE